MFSDLDVPPLPDTPDRCVLQHRVFSTFGEVTFRRAEADETPVMVLSLGERQATVPLRALQRELGIADDSPDGRMLWLIAQSLDFVVGLQIGDPLPSEVVDGRASWTAGAAHRALASSRLRLQLAAWLRPEAAGGSLADADAIRRLDDDPAMRQHVQAALAQAARDLGLPGPADILGVLAQLAEELAYIEALREGLLLRVRAVVARIERMCRVGRVNEKRQEMLTQVRRLSSAALGQIAARFDDVDAQSGHVLAALGDVESQRVFIRSNRDWLFRVSRGWAPILAAWDEQADLPDIMPWKLMEQTYRFLAPRYMPVQEWQAFVAHRQRSKTRSLGAVMEW
jgi:hypothetical protein